VPRQNQAATNCGAVYPATVAVCAGDDDQATLAKAAELARTLGLPLTGAADTSHELLLAVTAGRLELRTTLPRGPGPVYAEFVEGALGYSRRVSGSRLLFQAIGFRAGPPSVVDATAGLGQDAFVLAWKGCRVTAIERSPITAALLQDGLQRAMRAPELEVTIRDRLRLIIGDARSVLKDLPDDLVPDVVYLDPMYPARSKSALGRKEMAILRRVVGHDEDAAELLEVARTVVRRHVVVKRMHHAPPLALQPTRVYTGKTTRYDVYARRL
jgi:16S rRNA (guanine1516-N2)-methyltransferase